MFANKLGDLDDFIAPSVECIIPLVQQKTGNKPAESEPEVPQVQTAKKIKPNLIKSTGEGATKIAAISLQDCLACSGCVTSAEAVLIQQHSTDEFLKLFEDPEIKVVVAISPQSVSSLSHFASTLDGTKLDEMLTFKKL